jgi:DNA (cytosine-5)-methyltransferase 1
MLRVLDLFSGIGGFSLGLERTGGFTTVAFCEIEPFCQRVLAKHWPKVPIYDDVRELTGARLAADGIAVDVICGGFPCQDISFAGKRAGLEGARSGLWSEYGRLIGELRPRFVIVENVPGLLSLGMGTVLGDLAALRYDAVWDCVPAAAVGAPHRRDRVWLVAHPQHSDAYHTGPHHAHADTAGQERQVQPVDEQGRELGQVCGAVSHAISDELRQQSGRSGGPRRSCETQPGEHGTPRYVADAHDARLAIGLRFSGDDGEERQAAIGGGWWAAEPDVGRVAHGVPSRVDRLRSLGNAVVPQVTETWAAAILEAEGAR